MVQFTSGQDDDGLDLDDVHLFRSVAGTAVHGLQDEGFAEVVALTISGIRNTSGESYEHTYVLEVEAIASLVTMLFTGARVVFGSKAIRDAMDEVQREITAAGGDDPPVRD